MGLDNYLTKDDTTELPVEVLEDLEGLNLCGGMFSGNGTNGSFRGKVYAEEVEQITGVSLYESAIPPETLRSMADAMIRHYKKLVSSITEENFRDKPIEHIDEVGDLAVLFAVGAKHGCTLVSWY
tara:strand:+ start:139 stop:513 length:375 start_codon:yes stop_codon:yes gene_type:complete